ncbi:MAG: VOC family protein [Microthrixaceae bacterium]|nr:VOC family protein [Microthrixaceae bacterium]MCB1010441.1 VOC family protein [Microthrixaceae bacterium]MCB9387360.1 VOC family protein [Microthrixaceae bacterium]MCO5322287.1 VOC family protein [Microthrixaceae bacterium]
MPAIVPNLWFDGCALEAAEFWCGVFPNSSVTRVTPYTESGRGETGSPMTVEFQLDGQRFVGINGGPMFAFSEAVSFQIDCEDQAEIDHYWERLGEGGAIQQCGWLKDRYGVSWQVVPAGIEELLSPNDPERADRVMAAITEMVKLDVAAIREAADGA